MSGIKDVTESLSKAELKQIDLNVKDNRILYLYKIITIVKERLCRLERYIVTLGVTIAEEYKGKPVPYDEAMLYFDAVEQNHCYLLNVLGDSQNASISYFKYRSICKKKKYEHCELDEKTEKYLIELNKQRNFCNHIPESILVEDICYIRGDERIQKNKSLFFRNVCVAEHVFMDYSFFMCKHEAIKAFYFAVKHLLECIIQDYECVVGDEIIINTMPLGILTEGSDEYVKRAAKKVQKIDASIPDEWIEFED